MLLADIGTNMCAGESYSIEDCSKLFSIFFEEQDSVLVHVMQQLELHQYITSGGKRQVSHESTFSR